MRERSLNDSDHSAKFKSALLQQIQGYKKTPGVLLVACTNRPSDIDEGNVAKISN